MNNIDKTIKLMELVEERRNSVVDSLLREYEHCTELMDYNAKASFIDANNLSLQINGDSFDAIYYLCKDGKRLFGITFKVDFDTFTIYTGKIVSY